MKNLRNITCYLMILLVLVSTTNGLIGFASERTVTIDQNDSVLDIEAEIETALSSVGSGGTVIVTGEKTNVGSTLFLTISETKKVIWDADFSSTSWYSDTTLIYFSGKGTLEVQNCEINCNSGVAILANDDSNLIINNSAIYNSINSSINPTIQMGENSNLTVFGTSKVEARADNGQGAVYSIGGNVNVSGSAEIISSSPRYAVSCSSMTVDDSAKVQNLGEGNAVWAKNNVVIKGNSEVISVSGDAIYNEGNNITVSENAMVSAASGYAVYSPSASASLTVNGGCIFAYGSDIKGSNNVINLPANPNGFNNPSGTGTVIAWNQKNGNTTYMTNSTTDISKLPSSASAYWAENGSECGIKYINGSNSGFIPLPVKLASTAYGISLSQTGTYQFPTAEYWYPAQTPVSVTVNNIGSNSTGTLNISISNNNFTLGKTNISNLTSGSSAAFTVVPKTGLAAGTYSAVVTVSGNSNIPSKSFNVLFAVNDIKINRLYGETRIDTANNIAKSGWISSQTVILANGKNFADALAGGPLSYALDAPILLTANETALEQSVLDTISSLNAQEVIILGGTAAVKASFETQLSGLKVKRLQGETRYATAVEIAKELSKHSNFDTVYIANGSNFPDALAASPVASIKGCPILFTNSSDKLNLNTYTKEYLSNIHASSSVVLGGTSVISDIVISYLPNSIRIAGENRYETATAIYNTYKSIFSENIVSVATGTNFPDALAGSAYSAKIGAPLILMRYREVNDSITTVIKNIKPGSIVIFGGTTVLNDATVKAYI